MIRITWGWFAALALGAAQAQSPSFKDRVENYVVQPGDTLSTLTQKYLGDAGLWAENWKLNPGIADPARLEPGQTIRLIMERQLVTESAHVVRAVNTTEKMIRQPEWRPATAGDLLNAGNGLRTRERSTAELRFNRDSSLRLNEFSQIFLASKETTLRGVDRGSIQVERGDVDVVFAPLEPRSTELEIIAGPAVARPKSEGKGKTSNIRTGTTEDGGAKLMVYGGRSEVASGGATVNVGSGMGSRIRETGAPGRPEKLLPAPTLVADSQSWNYNNGRLAWQPVPGAARYALKACRDEACSEIIQSLRIEGGGDTAPQLWDLPKGLVHWQVYAISASDLDGYTAHGTVDISVEAPDLDGPMIAFRAVEGSVTGVDGSVRLGPQAMVEPVGFDERSGFERFEVRTAEGAWAPWDGKPIAIGAMRGKTLPIAAVDTLGNRTELDVEVVSEPLAPGS